MSYAVRKFLLKIIDLFIVNKQRWYKENNYSWWKALIRLDILDANCDHADSRICKMEREIKVLQATVDSFIIKYK